MAAKTKKVILFIAEGPTDEDSLSPILKKLFQDKDVRFHVVHGDITSDWSTSGSNALITVHKHIKIEMERYGFNKKDIIKVIHLIDTDGAFIPAEKIILGTSDMLYFEDHIESIYPSRVMERNARKAQILSRLYSSGNIGKIPYSVYYFSRNLEHVLHNDNRDLTDDEKAIYADTFADTYVSNPEEFKKFIFSSEFAVFGQYIETWKFIMQDINSLNRYCNLHLLFQKGQWEEK